MKKGLIITVTIIIVVVCSFVAVVLNHDAEEYKVTSYAAVMSTFDKYEGKSETTMRFLARTYILFDDFYNRHASFFSSMIHSDFSWWISFGLSGESGGWLPSYESKEALADDIKNEIGFSLGLKSELSEDNPDRQGVTEYSQKLQKLLTELEKDNDPDMYDYIKRYYEIRETVHQ